LNMPFSMWKIAIFSAPVVSFVAALQDIARCCAFAEIAIYVSLALPLASLASSGVSARGNFLRVFFSHAGRATRARMLVWWVSGQRGLRMPCENSRHHCLRCSRSQLSWRGVLLSSGSHVP
jgi:hypothetical protein